MTLIKSVCLVCLLSLGVITPSFAGIAIIIHPENNNEIDLNDVRKIFLGKTKTFLNGSEAIAYDLKDSNKHREDFGKKVLRKNPSSLNSYWSRMLFSSKGKPPKALSSSEMKKAIAGNKKAIGYIDSENIDSSVKVLMTVE